jgi:hypothetical protein
VADSVAQVKARRLWTLVACLALAACGTKERNGEVGDTLEAGSVKATVTEFSSEVPGSKPDAGRRYFGARLEVCKDSEQSINAFAFGLSLDGDGEADHVYPQRAYDESFDSLRDGCEEGWLVFNAPADSKPSAVKFKYEDTGQGGPGGDDGEKLEFEWAVPG